MKRLASSLTLALTIAVSASMARAQTPVDLIVTNAAIWTADLAQPTAEAVAVIGERIVDVGTSGEIEAWRGPETTVLDAGGKRVLPGFNDSHVHLVQAGEQLASVHLKDADAPKEFRRRIAEHAASLPDGEWILGGDWDEQLWEPAELPTKELIDEVTPDHPVFIIRYDGHMALVEDVIPPPSYERRRDAALRGLRHAASLGVTSLQDMTTAFEDIAVFMDLEAEGKLTARLYVAPPEDAWSKLADLVVLSDDVFEIAPETWPEVTVETTIVGGRIVYSK